jgi:hypothetical protein
MWEDNEYAITEDIRKILCFVENQINDQLMKKGSQFYVVFWQVLLIGIHLYDQETSI